MAHTRIKECITEKRFSKFSTETYVVGTQKNRLNETVLLSTKKYANNYGYENIHNFMLKMFCLSKPVTLCIYDII